MIIQAFGFVFALFALSRTYLRFKEGKISRGMLLLWVFVWCTVIAFLFAPSSVESLSKSIGIQRPLDFMFIVGLIVIYYLNFRLYVKMEDVRSEIAVLVREFGIGEKKK